MTTSSTPYSWKRLLPGFLISALALAVVIYLLDIQKFKQALLQADLRFIFAATMVTLLWLLIRGAFWRTLLQNKASYRDSFYTINEGYLLNNILPFRLGEIARAFLMSRKSGLAFWQIIPSIFIERALDLAIAVGIFLSTLPFVFGVDWAKGAAIGTGILVVVGLGSIYIMARNRERILAWVEQLGQRKPVVQKITGRRVIAFFDGLQILTDARLFLRALSWEGLNWFAGVLQSYLCLWAFIPRPSLLGVLFILGVSSLGIAAPSSPGALGVYEAVLVGALVVLGVDPSTAAAFAITMHAISYILTGLIGGFALYKDGESLSNLYTRLRKIKSEGET